MKLIIFIFVFSMAALANSPVEKEIPINHIYIPEGFDSNDNVEIVINGTLPNLCHRSPMTKVSINGAEVKIKMTSLYYDESDYQCPQTLVPFIQTVSLGLLDANKYKIFVNKGTSTEAISEIKIEETTSNTPDKEIYANVEYVDQKPGTRKVLLKGFHPSDCFKLDKIKWISNKTDTYSILPIVKQTSQVCPTVIKRFVFEFNVPTEINRSEVLLHVRGMMGKSINTIFRN